MPLFLGEDKISRVIMSVESVDGGTNTNDATLSSGAQMLQGVTAYSKGAKYIGTIATVEGATPDISVSSDGLIAASVSNPKGYQAESTTKTTTQQLTTKGATTITPSSASQTAVNSGVYTTGKITVSAVPTETKKNYCKWYIFSFCWKIFFFCRSCYCWRHSYLSVQDSLPIDFSSNCNSRFWI